MAWFRLGLGLLIWCAAIGGAWSYLAHDPSASRDAQRTAAELWQYSTGRHRSVTLAFPFPADVRPRDPIFARAANGEMRQVGEIAAVEVTGPTVQASALLYASAPAVASTTDITFYRARVPCSGS